MESWLQPMLCSQADVVPEGDEWIMERKIDGWRAIVHVTETGKVRLYGGRNGSEYTGRVPYIEGVCARLPADTAIDGELMAPEGWGSVQGVMTRTSTGPHEPTAESPPLLYVVFDVLRIEGTDVRPLPWSERRALLEAAALRGPIVKTSQTFPADARTHEAWVAAGAEGSVMKRTTSRYSPGKGVSWVKVKPQQTCEAKIIGFKPGKKGGAWDGKVGAFEVELYPAEVRPARVTTTVKCGTDETHLSATNEPDKWLGATIEIKHHGIGKSGVPRHPQFSRRREDKMPAKPPKVAPQQGRASSPHQRNYKRMGDEKLLTCLAELEGGYGDATMRAEHKHTGRENELAIARTVAREKGLI